MPSAPSFGYILLQNLEEPHYSLVPFTLLPHSPPISYPKPFFHLTIICRHLSPSYHHSCSRLFPPPPSTHRPTWISAKSSQTYITEEVAKDFSGTLDRHFYSIVWIPLPDPTSTLNQILLNLSLWSSSSILVVEKRFLSPSLCSYFFFVHCLPDSDVDSIKPKKIPSK